MAGRETLSINDQPDESEPTTKQINLNVLVNEKRTGISVTYVDKDIAIKVLEQIKKMIESGNF